MNEKLHDTTKLDLVKSCVSPIIFFLKMQQTCYVMINWNCYFYHVIIII